MGSHKPGASRSNQYASWTNCKVCGLRLSYVSKRGYVGENRVVAADPVLVLAAQEELQVIYRADEMNEKIMKGKLMELKGRELVSNAGHGSSEYVVRANEERGKVMLEQTEGMAPPPATEETTLGGYTLVTGPVPTATPTTPSTMTPPRTSRSPSPASPSSAPGAMSKASPTERPMEPIPDRESRMTWQSLQKLRKRMSADDPVQSGPMDHNLQPDTNTDTRQLTPMADGAAPTCTTSTTSTTKDILSTHNGCRKEILPTMARKVAKAAVLTAALMTPVKDLMASIETKYDLVEIACSGTSTMTRTFEAAGYQCFRVNQLSGFNLDSKQGTQKLKDHLEKNAARLK